MEEKLGAGGYKRLHVITAHNQGITNDLLAEACEKRGIECKMWFPEEVNPLAVAREVKSGDAIYRVATGHHYGCAELELSLMRPDVVTFYKDNDIFRMFGKESDSITLERAGVPVPKTASYVPGERQALMECVMELGGFPIIIKGLGGSHGVGVMRIDSRESLFSVSDYLRGTGDKFVLKEYCDVTSTARLVVLGDKVIDSIEYSANKGDFRSNEGAKPNVASKKFSPEVEAIAVKAVQALGREFGGVDIMLTEQGPKVAEVNTPCFFARCQIITGTDIAGMMVDYLMEKSERLKS